MQNFFYEQKLPVGRFATNKELLANAYRLNQVHGNVLRPISQGTKAPLPLQEGDGWWWKWKEVNLQSQIPSIITADCLPIVVLGKLGGIFVHAGWRGVQKKIVINPILEELDPYFAFIGPSIQKRNFQVTEEFYEQFPDSKNFSLTHGTITFDLQQEIKDQLKKSFPLVTVHDAQICTFEDKNFHSFRREKVAFRNYHYYLVDKITKDQS